jgi:hypothetical protein
VLFTAGCGHPAAARCTASDAHAAYVPGPPVSTSDIATIYHLLGIDPEMKVYDDRPVAIALDRPIAEILG